MSTKTFTCRRITCREAFSRPEWPALEKAYGEEILYEDLPPAPDRRMYELLEAQGILRPVGLFEGEELIGFAAYITTVLPHFGGGRVLATCESIWLREDRREGTGAGSLLLKTLFSCAKDDGAYGMYLGAKIGTQADKIFDRIAKPVNTLYWRKL